MAIRDGFALIKRTRPSIAIVDITLKGSNGLELLKDLRAHGSDSSCIESTSTGKSIPGDRELEVFELIGHGLTTRKSGRNYVSELPPWILTGHGSKKN